MSRRYEFPADTGLLLSSLQATTVTLRYDVVITHTSPLGAELLGATWAGDWLRDCVVVVVLCFRRSTMRKRRERREVS